MLAGGATFEIRNDQALTFAKRLRLQRNGLDVALEGGSAVQLRTGANDGLWRWQFNLLTVELNVVNGHAKWTYRVRANRAGDWRAGFTLTPQDAVQSFAVYNRKATHDAARPAYMASYGFGGNRYFRPNWLDMAETGVLGPVEASADGVTVWSRVFALTPGQTAEIDPSFTNESAWGADIGSDGSKYPGDGSDFNGRGSDGLDYRTPNRFSIADGTFADGDTVNQVDFSINVQTVTGASGESWYVGPYQGSGLGDPEADAGATAFSRCDVSGDNYVTTTSYQTTGVKNLTSLGGNALTDMEAARTAGSLFTMAVRIVNETSGTKYDDFSEYSNGTAANRPQLTVDYTVATAGTTVSSVVAAATATAPVPAVAIVSNPTIAGVVATATATAPLPTIAIISNATIAGVVAEATAAALDPLPLITAIAVAAAAAADANAPTIVTTANIASVVAAATATANEPIISTGNSLTVASVVAAATAAALDPSLSLDNTIAFVVASATAAGNAPVVAIVFSNTISGVVAVALAEGLAPAVLSDVLIVSVPATAATVALGPRSAGAAAAGSRWRIIGISKGIRL